MPAITELSRIEPAHLEKLKRQGVSTTGLLLEISSTPTRRQYLADHVGATTNQVLTWRDEALLLSLATFGVPEHRLLTQAHVDGIAGILSLDEPEFRARILRASRELRTDPPDDLRIGIWWEQARTLEGG